MGRGGILGVAVACLLAALLIEGVGSLTRSPWELAITMRSDASGQAKTYYRLGPAFVEENSRAATVFALERPLELRFPLPAKKIRQLRFDPLDGAGRFEISAAEIRSADGQRIREIPLEAFQPTNEIERMEMRGGSLLVVSEPDAVDPFSVLELGGELKPPSLWERFRTGAWMRNFFGLLLLAGGLILCCEGYRRYRKPAMAVPRRGSGDWWIAVGLFILVLGSRLWLIEHFVEDVPYWDQWDADGVDLIIPLSQGELGWRDLLQSHNEHRIVFTRLITLLTLWVTDTWDVRFQCVVNALIPSFLAAFLYLSLRPLFPPPLHRSLWAGLIALLFALPFTWTNTVSGFQSQFYFFITFGLMAVAWLGEGRPLVTLKWWLGLGLALAASFSMGPGVVCLPAAGALYVLIILRQGRSGEWVLRMLCIAIFFALFLWVASAVLGTGVHTHTHASGPVELIHAFLRYLAWPLSGWIILAPLLWMPFGFLVWRYLRKELPDSSPVRLLIGAGCWAVFLGFASAYSRGHGAPLPISRYADPLAIQVLVNLGALMVLNRTHPWFSLSGWVAEGPRRGWLAVFPFSIWAVAGLNALGLGGLTLKAFGEELPERREEMRQQRAHAAEYVISEDPELVYFQPFRHWIHPNLSHSAALLRDPALRRVFPRGIAEPIEWKVRDHMEAAFAPDRIPPRVRMLRGERVWGSFLQTYPYPGAPSESGRMAAENAPPEEWDRVVFHALFTVPKNRHFIHLEVAGWTTPGHQEIFVVEAEASELERVGLPIVTVYPGNWHSVFVPVEPGRSYEILARANNDPYGWMALTQPRAVHRLSYLNDRFSRLGPRLMAFGLAILFFSMVANRSGSIGDGP